MMDVVFIEALEVDALIGVYDWERRMRQPLLLDIGIEFDNRAPAVDDALELTVDYAEVCAEIRRHVDTSAYALLETLLERLAAHLLKQFPAAHAFVLGVRKPAAARALGCAALGIRIRRVRE
jgi:7,8-dihydroneopterin aldolase/epimerase/oxygenase